MEETKAPSDPRNDTNGTAKDYKKYFLSFISFSVISILSIFALQLNFDLRSKASNDEIQKKTDTTLQAQRRQVRLYFSPSQVSVPPEATLNLMFDSRASQIGFARIELAFDQSKITLTKSIVTTPLLKTGVTVTSMEEANATGKILLVLGLAPVDRATPPTGTFEFAQLSFSPKTPDPNQSATLSFTSSGIQLVDINGAPASFTGETATIFVNSTTPTIAPTPTLSPTEIPTPKPEDVTPPAVTITKPDNNATLSNKGQIQITAAASDDSGILRMEIFFDAKSLNVCNNSTSCSGRTSASQETAGTHLITVTATDKSINGNLGTSTISVTMK